MWLLGVNISSLGSSWLYNVFCRLFWLLCFIFDAAADTNTVIDGNSDTDADIGICTNTNIVTIRPTENYMPLRYAGMLHVIRYAFSGMLLLVFGDNSLYMYRCSYGDRSRDRYGRRHIVVVGARRTTMNTADTGYRYRYVSTDKETDTDWPL